MILITMVLCLMLCGCAAPEAALPPETESPVLTEARESLSQRWGLDAQVLPVSMVHRVIPFGDGLLLVSGQEQFTLTLINRDFQEVGTHLLEGLDTPFSRSLQVGSCISWFSPETRQTRILDSQLQPVRQVPLPQQLAGMPLLSSDGHTLYYCTSDALYGWDLSNGIRRRIKDLSGKGETLSGIHLENTVLECTDPSGAVSFLRADTGQLIHSMAQEITLTTWGQRYYAAFAQGFREALVFGTEHQTPQALLPEDLYPQNTVFLPEQNSAVTISQADGSVLLQGYDLTTGQQTESLNLDTGQMPLDLFSWQNVFWLLVYDPEFDCHALLRWDCATNPSGRRYTEPYYTEENPNQHGLTVCQSRADALSHKYGITVMLWEEAVATEPWDYQFQPEHLYPPLLDALETLDLILSQYPQGMLRDTAAHFDSLNLCLVRSISSTAAGSLSQATGIQFLEGRAAYVVVSLGPYFRQAVYHELFHVMETHILTGSKALDHWQSLNPAGFAYDLSFPRNAQRNSGVYLEGIQRSFVDTYSMSFPKEDRARIFEYAMLPDQRDLFSASVMQKKLAAICQGIRDAYGLKSPEPLPWEQYLR